MASKMNWAPLSPLSPVALRPMPAFFRPPCRSSPGASAHQAHPQAVAPGQAAPPLLAFAPEVEAAPGDAVEVDAVAGFALGALSGRSVREDVTQEIFSRFCVGK